MSERGSKTQQYTCVLPQCLFQCITLSCFVTKPLHVRCAVLCMAACMQQACAMQIQGVPSERVSLASRD